MDLFGRVPAPGPPCLYMVTCAVDGNLDRAPPLSKVLRSLGKSAEFEYRELPHTRLDCLQDEVEVARTHAVLRLRSSNRRQTWRNPTALGAKRGSVAGTVKSVWFLMGIATSRNRT